MESLCFTCWSQLQKRIFGFIKKNNGVFWTRQITGLSFFYIRGYNVSIDKENKKSG